MQCRTTNTGSSPYFKYKRKPISESDCIKFLGLSVDSRPRFKQHCSMVQNKLSSAYYSMRNLRTIVNINTLPIFYFSYVESRLRYGIIFWGRARSVNRLFIYKKKIVKCMVGVSTRDSCRPIYKALRILHLWSLYLYEI